MGASYGYETCDSRGNRNRGRREAGEFSTATRLRTKIAVLIYVAPGVVGAAHERAGLDVAISRFFPPNVCGALLRITEATLPSAQTSRLLPAHPK